MTRDFTLQKEELLKCSIKEVSETGWNWVEDKLNDVLTVLFLEPDIEEYLDNIGEYHRQVLDMHNTKASKITEIFAEVRDIDWFVGADFRDLNSNCLQVYSNYLKKLSSAIRPCGTPVTAQSVICACKDSSEELAEAEDFDAFVYDREAVYANNKMSAEIFWSIVGGFAGMVGNVVGTMAWSVLSIPGIVIGMSALTWEVIDAFVNITSKMEAQLYTSFAVNGDLSIAAREKSLRHGEEIGKVDDISSCLKHNGYGGAAVVAGGINVVAEAVMFVTNLGSKTVSGTVTKESEKMELVDLLGKVCKWVKKALGYKEAVESDTVEATLAKENEGVDFIADFKEWWDKATEWSDIELIHESL